MESISIDKRSLKIYSADKTCPTWCDVSNNLTSLDKAIAFAQLTPAKKTGM